MYDQSDTASVAQKCTRDEKLHLLLLQSDNSRNQCTTNLILPL